jgi:aspartate 1-decarboxylase
MRRIFLWSKIHRATVTETDVAYEGSLTLDPQLMEAAQMLPYEKIDVFDVDNGERFSTYLIPGDAGSGVCCVNGAAARKTAPGHKIILAAYVELEEEEIQRHEPYVVLLGEGNRIHSQSRAIIAGTRVT